MAQFFDRAFDKFCQFCHFFISISHGWRDSNSQPTVLETATLPIELHPFLQKDCKDIKNNQKTNAFLNLISETRLIDYLDQSMISVTCPAPTVRPPSRIAKRRPFSIAIELIRVTSMVTLSPGITMSTPSGSIISPVTSVVLK